ncbi:N-6 Adenine-specific DNA methylase [Rhodovulum sulfidophilum]|uniref:N-6 Adenine-specific DNA methylase n=1 Tax=Rhodovulum sulfidophilum TaxID=35806 RepID=A0A0D6B7J4_RHOSU|nr:N-6 Adenine-specific DNA methylase [Rhodovulum sulfidophilum]
MRIVAGRFRGRALASVGKGDPAAHLRPTTDRVRESLFNLLLNSGYGDPVGDARVLDLFAGTGALGLEALSRGAAHVTFLEDGTKALALIRENVALCRAEAETAILRRNAARPGPAPGAPATLVFLDPPYGKGLGEKALAASLAHGWIAPGALIVWEEGAAVTPPEGLALLDSRRYGETAISILEAP